MEIKIDFSELQRLQANLEASPQIVREELERAMTEADLLIEREVTEAAPSASGLLRQSIHHTETVNGLAVEGFVGSSLNYVVPVELGTRPHFPPIEALLDWVRIRFHVTEKQARGIAFLIARKIARTGTKGAHMFERTFAALEPQIRQIFGQAQERIAQRITGAA